MNVAPSPAMTAAAPPAAAPAPAAGTAGEGFAELLAAPAGPAATAPARPSVECGPPPALEPREARCTALIFNEDGFFQAAVDGSRGAETDRGDGALNIGAHPAESPTASGPSLGDEGAAVSAAAVPTAGAVTLPAAGAGAIASAACPGSAGPWPGTTAATTAPSSAGPNPAAAWPPFAQPMVTAPAAIAARAPAVSLDLGPRAPAASGRTEPPLRTTAEPPGTDARLLFQHGAAEAQVAVQSGPLRREERDRLRVEMAKLLARHGFSGATLKLNGSPL